LRPVTRMVSALNAALLFAASASAAPLPFTGTLEIVAPGLETCIDDPPPGYGSCGFPMAFEVSAAGTADATLTAGGRIGSLALAGGTFALHGAGIVYNYTTFQPLSSVTVDAGNGAGSFGPSGGVMPLTGFLKMCLFSGCSAPPANITVPLSVVGAGGTATFPGAVQVTVLGAAWTTGTITAGFVPTPVAGQSSPGLLQLVTPIYVSTDFAAGPVIDFGYARLTLQYVPEPTAALLVALGAGGLAVAARARRR
jgi:hypothetical protein